MPMTSLTASFDAVVMLTWSDWKTEPRSNRYHYATRFARHLPVYFVQPDGSGDEVAFEDLPGLAITLVHIAPDYGAAQARRLADALASRGIKRPLVWLYNVYFVHSLPRLNPLFTVFHATEDYVAVDSELQITRDNIGSDIRHALQHADMIVAVSAGVALSYRTGTGFNGPVLTIPNGCDFPFWESTQAAHYSPPSDGAKVAFYQGGINDRLDYVLLEALADRLDDWQFWFCGKVEPGLSGWETLQRKRNVRYFGLLPSEGIAELASQSLVGLIPFRQTRLMQQSMPLKAYEYLACGLPVVTIPIDALASQSELFTICTHANDFAKAIAAGSASRDVANAVAKRRAAARKQSYDIHFETIVEALGQYLSLRLRNKPRLNILMLYDDRSTHVGTIREHLEAFQSYSRHNFHFLPATGVWEIKKIDFQHYDSIIVHYSIRLSVEQHLADTIAESVSSYRGPKLLFIQDEYDTTETARRWMERLAIDAVFTNVPLGDVEKVYPRSRFPHVDFLPTLTGYVPEDPNIELFARPMNERSVAIGYRGRQLPHHYGALGYEKYRIGVDVKRLAAQKNLQVDIEVDDIKRLYGLDWYRFVGSCRATLGTESGSNVFDFDGLLASLAAKHREMPFAAFSNQFLSGHEGLIMMNQVSPKIFEAIKLKTALVLFEGRYSGVVSPNEHYIPLKKDYSNIDDVFNKVNDLEFLQSLTERAYEHVILKGAYSYRQFVENIDRYIDGRAKGRRRASLLSMPGVIAYDNRDTESVTPGNERPLISDMVLSGALSREWLIRATAGDHAGTTDLRRSILVRALQRSAELLSGQHSASIESKLSHSPWLAPARMAWHVLPMAVRSRILAQFRRQRH
jgi:glycosyltransferase involved in cell wall biosynthesis